MPITDFRKTDLRDVQDDVAVIEHHWHSRWRVYPQDVTSSITLAAAAVADTFGDWVLIVPLDTVPFDFEIIGVVVEEADTTLTTYFIQLGYNTVNVAQERTWSQVNEGSG